ncbi:DUF4974 domain-containing protein [Sanguibacteroides justesenii]|uniref:DUF4974 domain-containing protein n=2 Tax=Sanguibacteroides justesenii TaxID=1547597 RepID=A0AB34R0K1_9PORP|nr:hypothetical protein IE90_14020 [Sanguibacteroides justesenii]PXZ42826.1 DUF4974 domain-containing protein [Sanguibacteroides justesenii]
MGMEIQKDIFYDIQACWKGTATDEETERVRQWIEEDECNRLEYERLTRVYYRLNYALAWDTVDMEGVKSRFMRNLKTKTKRYVWVYTLGGVAAACLLFFAITIWLNSHERQEPLSLNLAQTIGGHSSAMLILHDGQRVKLSADSSFSLELKGTLLKGKKGAGLSYEVTDRMDQQEDIEYNTLVVPRGGEYFLTLSDGTKVWLNSETELSYPVRFTGLQREVRVKGEAFFEVNRDTLHPFIVHTSQLTTRVLGTSFNVMAYDGESSTEVTLVSGEVEVANQKEKCVLKPGWQAMTSSVSGKIEERKVNLSVYVSWKEGLFDFNEMSLEELVVKLGRWYDVDFFFANAKAKKVKFTGAIKRSNSLRFMLDFVEKTSDVYFKVNGNVIQVYEK